MGLRYRIAETHYPPPPPAVRGLVLRNRTASGCCYSQARDVLSEAVVAGAGFFSRLAAAAAGDVYRARSCGLALDFA